MSVPRGSLPCGQRCRESHLSRNAAATRASDDIDIAIVANPPPGALAGLPKLRLIQSLWAGVERLLADTSVPADVPLARMVDPAMSEAMARDGAVGGAEPASRLLRYARRSATASGARTPQRRADEVTRGRARPGPDGRAPWRGGWPPTATALLAGAAAEAIDGIDCRAGEAALDALLASGEIVVNLLPLTPATRGLFDARRFARMRRGASLVNLARGAHVVEADLLAALDGGHLRPRGARRVRDRAAAGGPSRSGAIRG